MRRTAPKRLIAATLAVAGLIALPMPASVSADNPPKRTDIDPTDQGNAYGHCQKKFNPDSPKPFCPPPPA
jgi:hypothetical protein